DCTADGSGGEDCRRRGRSGCVTAARISCPAPRRARREGTAKSGVPKKTIRMLRPAGDQVRPSDGDQVPIPGAHPLLDLSLDEPALQGAEVLDEQPAAQMVDLVVEGAREEVTTFQGPCRAVEIYRLDHGALRPSHPLGESGQTETALFVGVRSRTLHD